MGISGLAKIEVVKWCLTMAVRPCPTTREQAGEAPLSIANGHQVGYVLVVKCQVSGSTGQRPVNGRVLCERAIGVKMTSCCDEIDRDCRPNELDNGE